METINKKNLKTAIDGIRRMNIPEELFDIKRFGGIENCNYNQVKEILADPHPCNTVACFIGWFPFVKGLEPVESDFIDNKFDYVRYSGRVLVKITSEKWLFIFSAKWEDFDNTLEGALARAELVLNDKYPDDGIWQFENFKQGWHEKST